jgi:nucleoside-diphosphate-sugar epimerase
MKVLIAGAGYVGSRLAERLAAGGHEAIVIRRKPIIIAEGVAVVQADVTDPKRLDEALPASRLRDLDGVVYCVAADGRDDESYGRAYVQGPHNLMRLLCARGAPPPRFLFVSSTGVYGERAGAWVDESTPVSSASPSEHARGVREALSNTARVLLEGEKRVLAAGMPTTVLRFSGIYGPGRTSLLQQVIDDASRSGREPSAHASRSHIRGRNLGAYSNRVHRDDGVGALMHVMTLANPAPLYIVSDTQPVVLAEVCAWLADQMGLDGHRWRARSVPSAAPQSHSPLGKRCSSAKLQQSGYRFQFPTFREGYLPLLPQKGLACGSENGHNPAAQ